MTELDVLTPDGRTLHVYDEGDPHSTTIAYWHHGGGMTGMLPPPLAALAAELGIRLLSHDRPGYGGSSAHPDRRVVDGAHDTRTVLDRLAVERAAMLGLSAGAMHAMAVAAILGDRVTAVATPGTPAPFNAPGLDPFAGMADSNVDEFRAAIRGRAALESHLASAPDIDLSAFPPADLAAMNGSYWDWQIAAATAAAPEGAIEDELASVREWGTDPASIVAPVLLIHGELDRFVPLGHARWVAGGCARSDLRVISGGGHISVIPRVEDALRWAITTQH